MKIPKSQIKENQYTSGREFLIKKTNNIYTGYYCIINNNLFFTEKTFDKKKSLELKKINDEDINKLNISNKLPVSNIKIKNKLSNMINKLK